MNNLKIISLEEFNGKISEALLFNKEVEIIYNNQSGYIPNNIYKGFLYKLHQLSWCLATVVVLDKSHSIQSNYVLSIKIIN